jgi:hypothetical protein
MPTIPPARLRFAHFTAPAYCIFLRRAAAAAASTTLSTSWRYGSCSALNRRRAGLADGAVRRFPL